MYVANPARANNASVVAFLSLAALLASCSGDGGRPTNPVGTGAPSSSAPTPVAAGTGSLTVAVTDPDGEPLANATVTVYDGQQTASVGTADSDQNGMVTIGAVPSAALVTVSHPLGYSRIEVADVRQAGSTTLIAIVQPASPVTVALLPVTAPAASISADRNELELQVAIVASAAGHFVPSSYGTYGGKPGPTPYLRLGDCMVWLDSSRVTPNCAYETGGQVTALKFAYDPVGTPTPPAAQDPYSALLLLDQSLRAVDYDPYDLRTFAVKHFIRRARTGVQADLIAVAGFAGPGGDTSRPPLLQHLPLWAPPQAATVFTADRFAQEAAVDSLQPLVGGTAPVFDALGAALTLTAAQAPATGKRAIVALLGGGDDSGLSESQRQAALASLRQQQADTGIQVVLIAGRLDEDSVDRKNLAELAAALRAPIIYAGYPKDWRENGDGLYSALDLAADLLSGSALPSVDAAFRMKSDQPGGFQSGPTLHGTLWIESDLCGMGCAELPLEFAVDIHTGVSP